MLRGLTSDVVVEMLSPPPDGLADAMAGISGMRALYKVHYEVHVHTSDGVHGLIAVVGCPG